MNKLQQIQELKRQQEESANPSIRIQRILKESLQAKAIDKLDLVKGDKGEPGYSPIKGRDYFTVSEINDIAFRAASLVPRPKDGQDGMDGKDGRNGETPVRLVDYWTRKDQDLIINEVISKIKVPKDGVSPKIEDILSEVKKTPIHIKEIQGVNELIDFLKLGGFRGGGGSSSGGSGITSINSDTTAAQTLVVGTSGTDFAIVDNGTGTHTFNLPTASHTNRGALSSADWDTFNNKGSGTVTSITIASSNGFAGSSSGGATPALTISTSITGILKGNGTAVSAASDGTDYLSSTTGITVGQASSQTLGDTTHRLTKLWATDITVTNAITGSVTGNAGTATAVAVGGITGLGTGVATALAVNIGTAGAFITFNGDAGTPSALVGTNITGTGASFTAGTATLANTVASANEATDTTCFPLFITASGTQTLATKNNAGFIYNSNTNALTATTFVGALTGTASGNLVSGGALGTPSSGTGTNITGIPAANILAGTFGTGSYTMDTQLTVKQIVNTSNAITASGNAATVPITSRISTVTNNSAATLTITITTTSAVDGQMVMVRVLDFSAVAQTITWVNTENSTVTAPTTSNGSTSLPLTVGFQYNNATSKWRCIASA